MDFLVVGGGPAGCTFAALAARAGASVAMIERDGYAQHRPGEHLAGRIRPMLDAVGVGREGTRGIAEPSMGIVSAWSDGGTLHKMYRASGQAVGLSVVRHRFDELLCRAAREAGATVIDGRARRIERTANGTWSAIIAEPGRGTRTITARSIVDASGRSACIARAQGARRINYGDLVAIVCWFEAREYSPRTPGTMLTIESNAHGWWSLSLTPDRTLVATLYTSRRMMRRARATADSWWTAALQSSDRAAAAIRDCGTAIAPARVYAACPSRSTRLAGDGWIAVGDAAIAYDPVAGQGVALAIETAFRAFEAARVDPSWTVLGPDYEEALHSRLDVHLEGRPQVYEEAAGVLPSAFLESAVTLRSLHG